MVAPAAAGSSDSPPLPLTEIQGNILRAYGNKYRAVRHLVLTVADPTAARRALKGMVDGDRSTPDVTPADRAHKEKKYHWCLNVGFTYQGLKALGVPRASLDTFPPEFVAGMVARAPQLADIGDSAPKHWTGGLGEPDRVHLIITIHGREQADLEEMSDRVLEAEGGRAFALVSPPPLDGHVMIYPETERRYLHFGYVDGISQPRFADVHDDDDYPDGFAYTPVGVVLLGYPSAIPHVRWRVPQPNPLGHNGTFNAFRVLGQDVNGFEAFLTDVEKEHGFDRELTAAKLCGRWRNGVPLSLAPTQEDSEELYEDKLLNEFDYVGGVSGGTAVPRPGKAVDGDPDGVICPIGAHIRRTNPRGAHIVQRSANRSRSLIRRGVPYGPEWDAKDEATWNTPRGLLGNFLCASLSAQFEAMQYDWINLGLQDPRITGSNDPLLGANDPASSSFIWPRKNADPLVLRGFPRFVTTRGGAYTFLPTLPGIYWIATQAG